MTEPTALAIADLGVRFDALWAVKEVTFNVAEGERRAIIGPNGAGKTTLVHAVSGVQRPTNGSIQLFGQDITRLSQHARAQKGLGRTYQIINVFDDLTVLENAYLSVQAGTRTKWVPFRRVGSYDSVVDRAETVLANIGLTDRADEHASTLSYGEQRQLEVALALATEPRVLLLDEPLAGLSAGERQKMRQVVDQIAPDVTILLVEHNMEMVLEMADLITVLNHGEVVAEGSPNEVRTNETVRRIYLGSGAA